MGQFGANELGVVNVIEGHSVIDLVWHVTWYEREMVELMRSRKLAGSELWMLGHEERNSAIKKMNEGRGVEEVLSESRMVFEEMLEEMGKLDDDDLVNSAAFEGMPGDWKPIEIIAGSSFEHYDGHFVDLESWLEDLMRRK